MEEISEEQKNIPKGQTQGEKFEAIESECDELKRETKMMIQQEWILKMREEGDFAIVTNLTRLLRERDMCEVVNVNSREYRQCLKFLINIRQIAIA
ncbi:hypothetical protein CRYUN_Cryun10bG0169600 [Craigia yunnanensis]